MIIATMPDRKRTMTKEFMMLDKHKRHTRASANKHQDQGSFRERVHNVNNIVIPKPLDVGVRHGDQDVVPSRGPFDRIVFL